MDGSEIAFPWLPMWFRNMGAVLQWLVGVVGISLVGTFLVWLWRWARLPLTRAVRWIWLELSPHSWSVIECAESVSMFQDAMEARIEIDSLGRGKATIWLRFCNRCPWPVEVSVERMYLRTGFPKPVFLGTLDVGPLPSSFGAPGNEISLGRQVEIQRDIAAEDVLNIVGSNGMFPGRNPGTFVSCRLEYTGRVRGPKGVEVRQFTCHMYIPIYRTIE